MLVIKNLPAHVRNKRVGWVKRSKLKISSRKTNMMLLKERDKDVDSEGR